MLNASRISRGVFQKQSFVRITARNLCAAAAPAQTVVEVRSRLMTWTTYDSMAMRRWLQFCHHSDILEPLLSMNVKQRSLKFDGFLWFLRSQTNEASKNEKVLITALKPREVVASLDKFIVGQLDAKKAVAIALRNRWRRHQMSDDLKNEVLGY